MSEPIVSIQSKFITLPEKNIDTDQLIPARFMTTTSSKGLGKYLLNDARHDITSGVANDHVLNCVSPNAYRILVAGPNFGCGSSREHAVWALTDFGFRVLLAPKIADIFRANALNNGLLVIEISDEIYNFLIHRNGTTITVNLQTQHIVLEDCVSFKFEIAPFSRHCLLHGIDRLDYLLQQSDAIDNYERSVKRTQ